MSTDQEKAVSEAQSSAAPRPRRPLQFSLFSMLIVMLAVAVVCSLTFSLPVVVALPLLMMLSMMLPAALTTVIIYGRGYQRTFCVGALFPAGFFLLSTLSFGTGGIFSIVSALADRGSGEDLWARLIIVGSWASSLLTGAACVGLRKLVEKRPDSP